jgi:hypothetical protein
MKRRPKQPLPEENCALTADSDAIVQIKVWLLGVSPMVWRRVLVPAALMLRELHGVIQVAMGWEGCHLYQFCLRAGRFGSWELSASSPDVTLAALRLRKGRSCPETQRSRRILSTWSQIHLGISSSATRVPKERCASIQAAP